MDVNSYRSGFCEPNNEWIWGVYNDASETIWYFGWQLFMACNGYYAQQGINVCINRALVESFPDTDIRKGLFLTESAFLPAGKTFEEVIYTDDDDINFLQIKQLRRKRTNTLKELLQQLQINPMLMRV